MSSGVEIPLADESEWEDEKTSKGSSTEEPTMDLNPENFSEEAIGFLSQMKDLQEQLKQEYLKVQRLEMAIKGFAVSLQEELKKGQQPLFYCLLKSNCTIACKGVYVPTTSTTSIYCGTAGCCCCRLLSCNYTNPCRSIS